VGEHRISMRGARIGETQKRDNSLRQYVG
jgi:hypothetical protein